MASDAELLEELSVFLNTNELVLTRTPRADSASSSGVPGFWGFPDSDESENSASNVKDDAIARKRKIRREKEIIRKQRYQRRLKQERETLREMEKDLTARLSRVKRAKQAHQIDNSAPVVGASFDLRKVAKYEREERLRAEQEQERLLEAVTTQASYLATLKGFFQGQTATEKQVDCPSLKLDTLDFTRVTAS